MRLESLRALVVGLLTTFVLAACGAPAAPSSSATAVGTPAWSLVSSGPGAASVPPSPVVGTIPPSFPPADSFTFHGAEPAITTASAGLPDERYVNPGAVLADRDGTLHLFANVFSSWPGPVQVVHFRSSDGLRWSRVGSVAALSSAQLPFASPGSDVSTGFVVADGRWVLVIESVPYAGPWQLYAATAPGPDGPWTVDASPILAAGSAGTIDDAGLHWPSVIPGGPGYLLYYRALSSAAGPGVIALATSTDGRSWSRTGQPLLVPDRPFEGHALDRPRVVAVDGGFRMLYSGSPLTNRAEATSVDGRSWAKLGDGPVIDSAHLPAAGQAFDCALFRVGGRLVYLLEVGTSSGGTADYAATSP